MDVDGVLTDGSLILLNDGQLCRTMHIRDGYAIQLAVKKGYHLLIISGANDPAVKTRLNNLGVTDIHLGIQDKATLLAEKMQSLGVSKEQVLYIGDDMPDLSAMKLVGLACCPKDACAEIKELAHYISPVEGGKGCVREIIEKILKLHNHWETSDLIAAR